MSGPSTSLTKYCSVLWVYHLPTLDIQGRYALGDISKVSGRPWLGPDWKVPGNTIGALLGKVCRFARMDS